MIWPWYSGGQKLYEIMWTKTVKRHSNVSSKF